MTLNPEEKKGLQESLAQEKERIEKTLLSFTKKDPTRAENYDTTFPSFGTALDESADEVEEYENLLSQEYALELRLKDINQALVKLAEDRYGQCENCARDIPLERLSVNPEANTCMACAKRGD